MLCSLGCGSRAAVLDTLPNVYLPRDTKCSRGLVFTAPAGLAALPYVGYTHPVANQLPAPKRQYLHLMRWQPELLQYCCERCGVAVGVAQLRGAVRQWGQHRFWLALGARCGGFYHAT